MVDKKLGLIEVTSAVLLASLIVVILLFPNLYVLSGIIGTLVVPWIFYAFDRFFKIGFKLRHYFYLLLLLILGTLLNPLFFFISWYDKFLHLFTPLIWCALIFVPVNKLKIKFSVKLIITLSLFLSIMVVHEIAEYSLDKAFNLYTQGVYGGNLSLERLQEIQSPLDDTMTDLILDLCGGVLFIVIKLVFDSEKKNL